MASLVRWNGKLLRKANGKLARGIECCCDYDPPEECPNCCIEITWGEFNGDGDLEETFAGMTVTLVMPTKNSRIVCDGEQVTVRVFFTSFDLGTVASDHSPYVTWDHAWKYQSHTPEVSTEGEVYENGLVEWGSLVGDPFEDTYEVVLTYTHCWADHGEQIGDIEAGDRNGNHSLITGEFCTGSADCCEYTITCEPCCFYVGGDEWEIIDGEFVLYKVAANGDRMKVTVTGIDMEKLTVCVPGAGVTLTIEFTPVEHTGDDWAPLLNVDAEGWSLTSHIPGEGNGSFDVGPAATVDWGTDVFALDYTVVLDVLCPSLPGPITISWDGTSNGVPGGGSVLIPFVCCDGPGECDNCYPALDVGLRHCTVELDNLAGAAVVEWDPHDYVPLIPAGSWKVIACWENYTTDGGAVPADASQRRLHYILQCCHPSSCAASFITDAFLEFVEDVYGLEYTNAVECLGDVPSPTLSVADIIAATECELAEPAPECPQEVYKQEVSDGTCPECPEDW